MREWEKTYKCDCSKCANRNVITRQYVSLALGIIDDTYCTNAETVEFENPPKCETEIYCKNYKEKKDE